MAQAASSSPELDARFEALHDASFGWARACCDGNPDDAADVLQTCYVKVLSGRAVFEGRSSFRTWWFGVIRLTALEARRRGVRELQIAAQQELNEPPLPPDVALLHAERGEALRVALGRLPDRQREVLHLVFYQGLSVSDAAAVMELSVGSARVHYDRGKKRLRSWLLPVHREDAADMEEDDA